MHRKHWCQGIAIGWLGIVLLFGEVHASMLTQLGLEELAHRADRALVGTVEAVNAHYLDHSSLIVTDVQIRCTQELLGVPAGSVFTVRHMGGEVDGWGQKVFGEASYRVGEEMVVLAETRGAHFFAVGMTQGALHVATQAGEKRVRLSLSGATLQPIYGTKPPTPIEGMSLQDVLTQLRGFFATRSPKPSPSSSEQTPVSLLSPKRSS